MRSAFLRFRNPGAVPVTQLWRVIAVIVQILLTVCSVVMAIWAPRNWVSVAGLVVAGLTALSGGWMGLARGRGRNAMVLASLCGAAVAATSWCFGPRVTMDLYHATIAWQMALVMAGTSQFAREFSTRKLWEWLAFGWGFLGTVVWLGVAYRDNLPQAFHVGIALTVILLLLCRRRLHFSTFWIQATSTLILLLLALPLLDVCVRPSYKGAAYLDPAKKYFSYSAAKGDPATFARWARCYLEQWDRMAAAVFMTDPAGAVPVRLRPGSQGRLFDSVITINSNGFRGKEFVLPKGDTYRIVVIGESTSFGCTINAGEKPWPELLEQLIRSRLRPSRPVEVINAGVPANELKHALYRLGPEILPLRPDLIISYHGYNGFGSLRETLPGALGELPPAYRHRPLKILGDCEYRLKALFFKRRVWAERSTESLGLVDPLRTQYAALYRQLIEAAQTNGIRLAVANFSMAVNRNSDPDVVAFYRMAYGSVYWQIRANEVHSRIVKELAARDPRVVYLDTQPGLDGDHEKFIDLVHLTQEGREELAESVFGGIKELLTTELAR